MLSIFLKTVSEAPFQGGVHVTVISGNQVEVFFFFWIINQVEVDYCYMFILNYTLAIYLFWAFYRCSQSAKQRQTSSF